MIKPTGSRLLVKMIPRIDQLENSLGLTLVDKEKHWRHVYRKGKVIAVGPFVREVEVGQVIVMEGSAGTTLDGREVGFGDEFRWLKEYECLAVEEPLKTELEALPA